MDYSFDVLVLWSRDLKPFNQICSFSALFGFIAIHVLILARHLAFVSPLAWGVLTPLDSHVQVLELGASQYPEPVEPLLLIRVTQR